MQNPQESSSSPSDENLVSARIGRPSQPERILDEFPNLTVTDYLRYRVTGLLPDDIESGMKIAAQEFIKAGQEAGQRKPEVEYVPLDYQTLHTSEEVEARCTQLYNTICEYIDQTDPDPEDCSNLVAVINKSHTDCLRIQQSLDPQGMLKETLSLLAARIKEDGISTQQIVTYLSIAQALTIVDHRSLNPVRELVSEVFQRTDSSLFHHALKVKNLQDQTLLHLENSISSFDVANARRIVIEVLPDMFNLDPDLQGSVYGNSYAIGRFSKIFEGAVEVLLEKDKKFPTQNISELGNALSQEVVDYINNKNFLCHEHAVKVLSALSVVYHADVPVANKKLLTTLCDVILDKKVDRYADSYPNVLEIKTLIRRLSNVADVKLKQPALIARPWYSRLGDLFMKPFARS